MDQDTGYVRDPTVLPPGDDGAEQATSIISDEDRRKEEQGRTDSWLIQKARNIYVTSTDYMTANITNTWERNLAHFRSEHAPGTVYRTQGYKRSKTFRPKTRANIKAQETSLAQAAFSTQSLLEVQPVNTSDAKAAVGAAVTKALAEHRLAEEQCAWFQTVIGAYQDTKVYGICVSHQYWRYEHVAGEGDKRQVIEDRPCVDLVEPENFRFDAMCDWRRPAQTSPYLVYMMPIYVEDALQLMERQDEKTGYKTWRKYSRAQLLSTRKQNVDNRVRQAREGKERIDPASTSATRDFEMLWAHLNIIRIEGTDVAYWTMGTELVLTDMELLTDMYPHLSPGERPFIVGFSSIEAHRNFPASDAEQGASLQTEINSVANQRLDNVKLALNKRYFIRRGSQIDLDALIRNVPGGGVMVNDPEKDVKTVETQDVTSSGYQEHDRLNVEFDELVGGFSPGSVQSNRALNETKNGMETLMSTAGAVQDYGTRIFFKTWMEPVLYQVVRMEQTYETDETILAIAAQKAEAFVKAGLGEVTDDLLQHGLVVRVNTAGGSTDPMKRAEKLIFATSQVIALPGMAPRIKSNEVANEIFGAVGYNDAARFFMNEEEYAAYAQENPPQPPPEIAVQMKELEIRQADNDARHAKEQEELKLKREIAFAELALKEKLTLEEMYTKLGVEQAKLTTVRDTTALKEANRMTEMNLSHTQQATKQMGDSTQKLEGAKGASKPKPKAK